MEHDHVDEERVFHIAREIGNADARFEYIQQMCGEDVAAVQRIVDLLEAHYRPSSLLESRDAIAPTEGHKSISIDAGQQIGRYKLLQKIGEGGFGVVFLAEQSHPVRRQVALKVVKPGMDTKEVMARFEAERQALAMMDHPNIAKVLDGGETPSGHPYFVMELVRGEPLTKFCDRNHLSIRKRLSLFASVCNAIQHAHQKGIIHRDIKPSNVLVTLHDGCPVPKVIDFGVAKAISQRLTAKTLFTAYGQMVGTPQYMSPEQAEMSGLDIDTRSDIYSLGVLLYELLTGSTPIEPTRLKQTAYAEVLRIICEEEPPTPSRRLSSLGERSSVFDERSRTSPTVLVQTVRGELDWIVMKALEKDRERRYETAKGFALDVQRYLSDEPVSASPPSNTYRLRKVLKRHRRLVMAAACIVVLLVAGILGTTSAWYRERQSVKAKDSALSEARRNREAADSERQKAEGLADSLAKTLYAADMNNAMTAWEKNDLRQLAAILSKYRDQNEHTWEWRYLKHLLDTATPKDILDKEGKSIIRVYSVPGSEHIVTTHSRGPVFTMINTRTNESREYERLVDGTFGFTFVALKPDGKALVHPDGEFQKLIVRHIPSMQVDYEIEIPDGWGEEKHRVSAAEFSPDGKYLAVAFPTSGVAIFDIESKDFGDLHDCRGIKTCEDLEYTSDGQYLAISSSPITVINPRSGELVATLPGHTREVTCLKFVSDDAWLVSGSRDRKAIIWDFKNSQRIRDLGPFDAEVRGVAFEPAQNRLALALRNRIIKSWEITSFTELSDIRSYAGLYAVTFDSNGRLIYGAFGSGVAAQKGFDSTNNQFKIPGPNIDTVFSGDGRHLISLYNTKADESNPEWGDLSLSTQCIVPGSAESLDVPDIPFPVRSIAVGTYADRHFLAVGGASATEAAIIELKAGGSELTSFRMGPMSDTPVDTLCFSHDGTTVYCGLEDGRLVEWQFQQEKTRFLPEQHRARVTSLAPYGKGCISGAGNGTIKIWDEGGDCTFDKAITKNRGTWIRGIGTFENTFALGLFGKSENGKRIYHFDSERNQRAFYGHTFSIVDVELMEQGKTLVTLGGDREIKLWSAETLEQRLALRSDEIFNSLAISPDETMIAAGTREGSIFIYRAPKIDR